MPLSFYATYSRKKDTHISASAFGSSSKIQSIVNDYARRETLAA